MLDLLAAAAFAAILLYWLFFRGTKDCNLPPGPPGALPIIGHMLQIDKSKIITHTMGKWADEYGPVMGIWLGGNYTVLLSDPKIIRDTLNDPNLNGRPDNPVFKAVGGGNYGLLFADGLSWTEQRRFTLRHLREFGFGKKTMETLILDEARDLLDGFKSDLGVSITGLGRRFSLAVLSSLWFIVSGERLHHDDPEMKDILEDVFHQMDTVFVQGVVSFLPQLAAIAPERSGFNGLTRAIDRANAYLLPYITRHEETLIEDQPRDFIDSFLQEMRRTKDPHSSFYKEQGYKNLLAVITDLFGAGAETTSTTLDWAVLNLTTHLHVQQKLQAEIDAVVGHSRFPSLSDKPKMPYTEAVMHEVMRHSSIAGLGLFHATLADMKIGGYDVPKGSWVVPNLKYVHHDPRLWDTPEEFNPERFLSTDRRTVVKSENLMPFVVGKRVCLGETLARDEFFLFLTCLFQRYSIEVDPAQPPVESAPRATFILKPQPYHVIMHERGTSD